MTDASRMTGEMQTTRARAWRWPATLTLRIVAGVVLGVWAIFVIWMGGWLLAAWVALAGARMAFEWERLVDSRALWARAALHGATVAGSVALAWLGLPLLAVGVAVAGTAACTALAVWLKEEPGWPLWGVLYLSLPCLAFVWLRGDAESGFATVLWLFLCIAASDIGAWATGNAVGGPKLWPSLSPGKTWAGLIGGTALATLFGAATAAAFQSPQLGLATLLSACLGFIGQAGDLYESAVKRRFHKKDSGGIIPGHGGMLDRLDSLIAGTAAVALYVLLWPDGPLGLG